MLTGSIEWWNHIASVWEEKGDYRDRPDEYTMIASMLSGSVLEIGCGFGTFAKYLPEDCYYTGVDISVAMISKAWTGNEGDENKTFLVGDIRHMDWPSKFDFTVCMQTLEHFTDPDLVAVMERIVSLTEKALLFSVPREPKTAHLDHQQEWLTEDCLLATFSQWGKTTILPTPPEDKHWVGVIQFSEETK